MGGRLRVVVVVAEVVEGRETAGNIEAVEVVEVGDVVETGKVVETGWHVPEGLKITNPGRFWTMVVEIQLSYCETRV